MSTVIAHVYCSPATKDTLLVFVSSSIDDKMVSYAARQGHEVAIFVDKFDGKRFKMWVRDGVSCILFLNHTPFSILSSLTGRQKEVVELLHQGKGWSEIARILSIKESSVRDHAHRVGRILGVGPDIKSITKAYRLLAES